MQPNFFSIVRLWPTIVIRLIHSTIRLKIRGEMFAHFPRKRQSSKETGKKLKSFLEANVDGNRKRSGQAGTAALS